MSYEHENWHNAIYTSQFFRFLLAKGLTCDHILDVGAHKTRWSREAKRYFPTAQICLIEPLQEMEPFLQGFCHDFPGSTYIQAGAGAEDGFVEMTIWPGLSGSSVLPPRGFRFYDIYPKRRVPIVTVDKLIETGEIVVPTLAKLDVQGAELDVLRGATRLFGKTEVFILEVSLYRVLSPDHPILPEVISYLGDKGYATFDIIGFYRRRVDHALAFIDMCFVKEDSPIRKAEPLIREHEWNWADCNSDKA